jgi:RNA polymerase sigma factor (sigma-70 family)
MDRAQTIALYQPTLTSIAYNIVRCKADAEDIVQETFLKWLSIDTEKIRNTKAYLIQSVTNNCLSHLSAIRKKKEECLESINVSEFLGKLKENNFANLDLEADLQKAMKLIHAKLEPLERAVYLLKEVFDIDYDALQKIVDKKKDHCRQMVCRAKKKLSEKTSHIHFDMPDASKLFASFKNACDLGNAEELILRLKLDISAASLPLAK